MHSCINTPGNYYCTCESGYTLNNDTDICQGNSCTLCYSCRSFPLKILMSVQLIMETVNSCVIIVLEVTGALVLLDTH